MKKIVFIMLAIGVLTSCGSAGNYCAFGEDNSQDVNPQENQNVVVVDDNTTVSSFS